MFVARSDRLDDDLAQVHAATRAPSESAAVSTSVGRGGSVLVLTHRQNVPGRTPVIGEDKLVLELTLLRLDRTYTDVILFLPVPGEELRTARVGPDASQSSRRTLDRPGRCSESP